MINIIVVFPGEKDTQTIKSLLGRNGYPVIGTCTSGAQAIQMMGRLSEGIVLCGYKYTDMHYSELYGYLPPHFKMLLAASPHILAECSQRDIVRLSLPLKLHDLVNTLEMMTATIERRKKRQRKAAPPKRSEDEQKTIDAAKKLLMERNDMSEDEAHRYLQKSSMETGNNLADTAAMLFQLMKF